MAAMQVLQWFYENKFSFNQLHSQQPLTLAYALADSPAGLLGWNAQLFGDAVDDEFILTNVAIYWLTNTAGSSMRFYYENAKARPPGEPTSVPIGLAAFAGDFKSIRRFAERDHKHIVQWHSYDEGRGHYAAHLVPDQVERFHRDAKELLGWVPSPCGLGHAELQFSGLAGVAAAASAAARSWTPTCGVFPLDWIAAAAGWRRSIDRCVKPCSCWQLKNSSEPTVLSTTEPLPN